MEDIALEGDIFSDKFDHKPILIKPPPYKEALKIINGYPKVSKTFKFDYKKLGVIQEGIDCLPACIAMCAKYWNHSCKIGMGIQEEKSFWEDFTNSIRKSRGTSINLINKRLRKKLSEMMTQPEKNLGQLTPFFTEVEEPQSPIIDIKPLRFKRVFLNHICEVIPPLNSSIQIPQIILYNHNLMQYKRPANHHAVILFKIDFEEREIIVIDPQTYDSRMTPLYPLLQSYSFKSFYKAWSFSGFTVLYVYPRIVENNIKFISQDEFIKERLQEKLDKFVKK